MEMDAKTLRALAKAAGLKPMVFFRLTPEQVLEAVKEHNPEVYKDVETWPNEVAIAHISALSGDKGKERVEDQEATETVPEVTEEQEIAQEKETAPIVKEKASPKKATTKKATKKEPEVSVEEHTDVEPKAQERVGPSKKRPKRSKAHGPITASIAISADMEQVKAQLELLEDQVISTKTMLLELMVANREMMLFFTWWHNKYLNEDPEPEILGIDWESCIKDQIN